MMVGAAVLAVAAVVLLLCLAARKPRGFPPGPRRLPFLGFLPYMEARLPFKQLWRLSHTYGAVVGLYFGRRPVVVVNGWEAVKESLLNEQLNGRPANLISSILYNGKQRGLIFTEGEEWKEQRHFTLHQFSKMGFAKESHESTIIEEIKDLIAEMKETETNIEIQSQLRVSSINILWAIMGGSRLDRQDPELDELVGKLNKVFRPGHVSGGPIAVFPPLRHLFPQDSKFNLVLNGKGLVLSFIKKSVEEHLATLDPNSPRDFIDIYLSEINNQEGDTKSTFTEDQLLAVCLDVFSGGVETEASTVSFAVLLCLLHPRVAAAVQAELDRVVGRGRLPSVSDRHRLAYTDATLHEVFRLRCATPFTVPHKALVDTTLQGHRVPAGTMVMNNLYSVHMDPQYWGDPANFRPERFINSDGSLRREERLLPFGKGRRVCPGESLARMTSFLLFSALMQNFNFSLDPDFPVTDTEGTFRFTLEPPEFRVLAESRF